MASSFARKLSLGCLVCIQNKINRPVTNCMNGDLPPSLMGCGYVGLQLVGWVHKHSEAIDVNVWLVQRGRPHSESAIREQLDRAETYSTGSHGRIVQAEPIHG